MNQAKLANLTPLPGELLYATNTDMAKAYNAKPDEEKFKEGGKWWSMYDLMKEFHSGILPEHGASNYLEFEIDFTSPHLKVASITDPNMVQEVNSTMTIGLQSLSSKIQALLAKLQMEANIAATTASTLGALRPRTGGKGRGKSKKWGGDETAAGPAAAGPAAAIGAPVVSAAEEINKLLSPVNLETECLKDLFRVKVNSWDRIFVTNAKKNNFPLKSVLNLVDPATVAEQVKIAAAAAAAEESTAGGGRRKTRKYFLKKYRKNSLIKSKTHRRRR